MFRAELILLKQWAPEVIHELVLYSLGIHIIMMLGYVKPALQDTPLRDSTTIQSMNIAKKDCSCFYMNETLALFPYPASGQ